MYKPSRLKQKSATHHLLAVSMLCQRRRRLGGMGEPIVVMYRSCVGGLDCLWHGPNWILITRHGRAYSVPAAGLR